MLKYRGEGAGGRNKMQKEHQVLNCLHVASMAHSSTSRARDLASSCSPRRGPSDLLSDHMSRSSTGTTSTHDLFQSGFRSPSFWDKCWTLDREKLEKNLQIADEEVHRKNRDKFFSKSLLDGINRDHDNFDEHQYPRTPSSTISRNISGLSAASAQSQTSRSSYRSANLHNICCATSSQAQQQKKASTTRNRRTLKDFFCVEDPFAPKLFPNVHESYDFSFWNNRRAWQTGKKIGNRFLSVEASQSGEILCFTSMRNFMEKLQEAEAQQRGERGLLHADDSNNASGTRSCAASPGSAPPKKQVQLLSTKDHLPEKHDVRTPARQKAAEARALLAQEPPQAGGSKNCQHQGKQQLSSSPTTPKTSSKRDSTASKRDSTKSGVSTASSGTKRQKLRRRGLTGEKLGEDGQVVGPAAATTAGIVGDFSDVVTSADDEKNLERTQASSSSSTSRAGGPIIAAGGGADGDDRRSGNEKKEDYHEDDNSQLQEADPTTLKIVDRTAFLTCGPSEFYIYKGEFFATFEDAVKFGQLQELATSQGRLSCTSWHKKDENDAGRMQQRKFLYLAQLPVAEHFNSLSDLVTSLRDFAEDQCRMQQNLRQQSSIGVYLSSPTSRAAAPGGSGTKVIASTPGRGHAAVAVGGGQKELMKSKAICPTSSIDTAAKSLTAFAHGKGAQKTKTSDNAAHHRHNKYHVQADLSRPHRKSHASLFAPDPDNAFSLFEPMTPLTPLEGENEAAVQAYFQENHDGPPCGHDLPSPKNIKKNQLSPFVEKQMKQRRTEQNALTFCQNLQIMMAPPDDRGAAAGAAGRGVEGAAAGAARSTENEVEGISDARPEDVEGWDERALLQQARTTTTTSKTSEAALEAGDSGSQKIFHRSSSQDHETRKDEAGGSTMEQQQQEPGDHKKALVTGTTACGRHMNNKANGSEQMKAIKNNTEMMTTTGPQVPPPRNGAVDKTSASPPCPQHQMLLNSRIPHPKADFLNLRAFEFFQYGHCHLFLGPAHTVTDFHYDPTDNFFVQLVGYKFFRLYPPHSKWIQPKYEQEMQNLVQQRRSSFGFLPSPKMVVSTPGGRNSIAAAASPPSTPAGFDAYSPGGKRSTGGPSPVLCGARKPGVQEQT
ncbi:unnamed protein product, partial [Amoebophrya sp. A120]|eukprot:GSA120T00005834001.1